MLPVCFPVWTMGSGQRADLSIITNALPYPLSCAHNKVLVKKRVKMTPFLVSSSLTFGGMVFILFGFWFSAHGAMPPLLPLLLKIKLQVRVAGSRFYFFILFSFFVFFSRPLSVPFLPLSVPFCLSLHNPTGFDKPLRF